jgi:hypothetical protein
LFHVLDATDAWQASVSRDPHTLKLKKTQLQPQTRAPTWHDCVKRHRRFQQELAGLIIDYRQEQLLPWQPLLRVHHTQ